MARVSVVVTDGDAVEGLHVAGVTKAYDRWAPVYDMVFGKVFARGRSASIQAAERVGGRVLEVGVGTGISLPQYSPRMRIVGVDISKPMLAKARRRVAALDLRNIEGLAIMNAERLDLPDGSFDAVVAQYVVTAVPNPEAALTEFLRVLRPGGEIILTSRLGAESGLRAVLERLASPMANRLGWRTKFAWSRYQHWAEAAGVVEIVERRPLPPLGHFSLIRMRKRLGPVGAAA